MEGVGRDRDFVVRAARDWSIEAVLAAPLIPRRDGAVRPRGSRLIWGLVPGVDRYLVSVAPIEGEETTRNVLGNQLVLDGLEPGKQYAWRVRPLVSGWTAESRWSTFRVLTAAEQDLLNQATANLGNLQVAVLLLAAELHEEAIHRLDAAIASDDEARSARYWRARALADIGLYDQAYSDLLQVQCAD